MGQLLSSVTREGALWAGFGALVLVLLALDLGVLGRSKRDLGPREALFWSAGWIGIALVFGGAVTVALGTDRGVAFFTSYVVEKALSVDNLFVLLLVFGGMKVPKAAQRKVLFWGVFGAVVLRGSLIFAGAALVEHLHAVTLLFGAFLVYAGIKLVTAKEQSPEEYEEGRVMRFARRLLRVTTDYEGSRFFVRRAGVLFVTPLLLALVAIETADVVFALDSIPAVFGVTTDRFIVFTSNIFAVLGLRALFFALSGLLEKLHYLKHGLAAVLIFIGAKMLADPFVHVATWLSLVVIAALLGFAIAASLLLAPRALAPRAMALEIGSKEVK
jgi:tellurite resistance protein TerC